MPMTIIRSSWHKGKCEDFAIRHATEECASFPVRHPERGRAGIWVNGISLVRGDPPGGFSLLEETAPADLEAFVPGGRADSNVGLRAADAVEFWFRVPVLRICERPKFGQYQNFGPYVGNRTAT